MQMTDADYSFEVPAFDDFNGADDNADQWFGEFCVCVLVRVHVPVSEGSSGERWGFMRAYACTLSSFR